jgi:ribokinase
VATALATLARLEIKTAFIGIVADDLIGQLTKEKLKKEGINLDQLRIEERGESPFSFITVEAESGYRNIFWTKGSLPPLTLSKEDRGLIQAAKVLHLDGIYIEPSLLAAEWARESHCRVVLDAGSVREGMKELVERSHIVIASQNFARDFTAEQTPAKAASGLRSLGPEIVAITLGEKGCYCLSEEKGWFSPGFKVKVIDTTGAGDVFHGAFTYGLLHDWPLEKIVRFANATAALKCTGLGGRTPLPSIDQVLAFLDYDRR